MSFPVSYVKGEANIARGENPPFNLDDFFTFYPQFQGVDGLNNEVIEKCSINIDRDNNIGHTIPQKISGKNDFVLSMRVRKPLKNPTIEIIQDDKVIKSVKMKKAIPAEMIQIEVSKENIKSNSNLRVVIK